MNRFTLAAFVFGLISSISANADSFTNCMPYVTGRPEQGMNCSTNTYDNNNSAQGSGGIMDSFKSGYNAAAAVSDDVEARKRAQQQQQRDLQNQQSVQKGRQINADAGKRAQEDIKEKSQALCDDPANQPYYSKTACKANEIKFDQELDQTKITATQKNVLKELYPKIQEITRLNAQNARLYAGPNGDRIGNLAESKLLPENDKNNLNLYSGKITWGEYNTKRKEIYESFMVDLRNITSNK